MITFNQHVSEQVETEKFIFTLDWSQVTKHLIDCGSELEPELTEMLYKPMWEKLITGINHICTNLVPFKILQCLNDESFFGILKYKQSE